MQEIQRLEMITQNNEDLDVSYHPDDDLDELAELEEQREASYGSEDHADNADDQPP